MLTIHIGKLVKRAAVHLEPRAVVDVLCDGRAQMKASQLQPGDVLYALGVVREIEQGVA